MSLLLLFNLCRPALLVICSITIYYEHVGLNLCDVVYVQDAHEFFCSLIDQVQEEVSSELKKQYSTEADRPKLETVCPTTQNFRLVSWRPWTGFTGDFGRII